MTDHNLYRVSFLVGEPVLHQVLHMLGSQQAVFNVEVAAVVGGPVPRKEVVPGRKSLKGKTLKGTEKGVEIVQRIASSAAEPVSVAILRREFEACGKSPYSVDSAVTEAQAKGLVKRVKVHGQKGFIQAVRRENEAAS